MSVIAAIYIYAILVQPLLDTIFQKLLHEKININVLLKLPLNGFNHSCNPSVHLSAVLITPLLFDDLLPGYKGLYVSPHGDPRRPHGDPAASPIHCVRRR